MNIRHAACGIVLGKQWHRTARGMSLMSELLDIRVFGYSL